MTSAHFSSCPAGRLRQLPAARLTGGPNPPHRWALILLRRKETITLLILGSMLRSAPADCSEQKQSPPPAKSGRGAGRNNTRLQRPPPPSRALSDDAQVTCVLRPQVRSAATETLNRDHRAQPELTRQEGLQIQDRDLGPPVETNGGLPDPCR